MVSSSEGIRGEDFVCVTHISIFSRITVGRECQSMVLLHTAYVNGKLRYYLPVLHNILYISRRKLEAARNNSLRICLGLSKGFDHLKRTL